MKLHHVFPTHQGKTATFAFSVLKMPAEYWRYKCVEAQACFDSMWDFKAALHQAYSNQFA